MLQLKNETITIDGKNIECPVFKGERFIAVTPVCNILGVDATRQKRIIKEHPIYTSTPDIKTGVATDGKEREMIFISFKYFFGWLFGIHPNKVKESNRDNLIKYQKEVCNILYEKFVTEPQFQKMKSEAKFQKMKEIEDASNNIKEKKKELKKIEEYSFADFKAENMQLSMF